MAEAETQTPPLSLEATEHNVEQRPLSEEEEDDDDEGSLPQVVPVHSPRFAVTDREGYLAYLDEHGYCVIASVADEAAVARAKVSDKVAHTLLLTLTLPWFNTYRATPTFHAILTHLPSPF